VKNAYKEGFDHYNKGGPAVNPYERNTMDWEAWGDGWDAAEAMALDDLVAEDLMGTENP